VYYEFLVAFYDLNVNEDSYFWSAKKVTKTTSSDLESFVELVGGVSSGESVLPADGAPVDHYKRRSGEFASAVDELVANNEQSMVPIIKSSIVKSAMQEGAKEQSRVMLGEDAEPETPLFDGGLIASPDGLGWSRPA
jgi:FAD-dependent halogenase